MAQLPQGKTFTLIRWNPVEERPEEGRYVLLQCVDEDGELVCDWGVYENGKFAYVYDRHSWGEINEEVILGWSYLPFDH